MKEIEGPKFKIYALYTMRGMITVRLRPKCQHSPQSITKTFKIISHIILSFSIECVSYPNGLNITILSI